MQYHKPRMRKVRILATLGPASDTPEMIEKLFRAGADAFRVNMSHGEQADKAQLIANIRALEKAYNRPTTILVDLQGPKLRVGSFAEGKVELHTGDNFVANFAVGLVSPPEQNIGGLEPCLGEAVFRLVEPGRGDLQPGIPAEKIGDGLVHAPRIKRGHLRVLFLVAVFAPDDNVELGRDGFRDGF